MVPEVTRAWGRLFETDELGPPRIGAIHEFAPASHMCTPKYTVSCATLTCCGRI